MSDEIKWHIAIVREVDGLEVEMGFDTPFELKRLLKTMSDHIGDDIPERISIEAIGDGDDD
ncbi:hypothetical protein [Lactiplantibacillus plantarum]|uniref:hypothetical protein n=1 Tax=Lactiplantibacillus plantarum TaxID=1590 RepID=UPI000BAB1EFA|nr:hypothetical protein [Lactiplantibacillus plantarum]ASX21856.1 hypothetical protein BGV74_08690 [Lactiplantibacillus plantarum]WMY71874.1 hypothetical protein RF634_06660 [Lactiplantibacillus plantarum]